MTTPNNKQAQHMPGPWEVRKFGIGMSGAHIAVPTGFSGAGVIIAVTSGAGTVEPEQDKANARLIAAAPELLEACRDALSVLMGLEATGVPVGGTGGEDTYIGSKLRAAIAKAEGRAS